MNDKRLFLILGIIVVFCAALCLTTVTIYFFTLRRQSPVTTAPAEVPPADTSTSTPLPTNNVEPPTPTITQSPTPELIEAIVTDNEKVYLEDKLLIDTEIDAPGCFEVGEIQYSPTREHFLVVIACLEGDNEAFLFRSDGSDKTRITTTYDYINYYEYEWASDGHSFTYQRINSCCLSDIPVSAPPPGLVRYDIETGEKTLIATPTPTLYRVVGVQSNDVLNVRAEPGADNPIVGIIPPDGINIRITGDGVTIGNSIWAPIVYEEIEGWVNIRYIATQYNP